MKVLFYFCVGVLINQLGSAEEYTLQSPDLKELVSTVDEINAVDPHLEYEVLKAGKASVTALFMKKVSEAVDELSWGRMEIVRSRLSANLLKKLFYRLRYCSKEPVETGESKLVCHYQMLKKLMKSLDYASPDKLLFFASNERREVKSLLMLVPSIYQTNEYVMLRFKV